MIKFKEKKYSIQEGHYSGPKDEDKIPGAFEVISKSTLGGAIMGALVGKIDKNSNMLDGSFKGAKYGTLAGIALKIILNYIHKPMSNVKYNEVDRNIRREFGIYRVSGITFGDKLDKRADVEDKFGFNDRNVTSYKLNFSIQDNKITMYTLGISNDELEKLNNILDYYCKKYYGMNYTSTIINQGTNSYSVIITFTNYQVISNFIMEVSNTLNYKINLLDNDSLTRNRIFEQENPIHEEKSFSVSEINKYDMIKMITKSGTYPLMLGATHSWKEATNYTILGLIYNTMKKIGANQNAKDLNEDVQAEDMNNKYLENTLNKLHYIENIHFSTKDKKSKSNISLIEGVLFVTVEKNSEENKKLDDIFWKHLKDKINRADTGKVIVYSYLTKDRSELDFILKKLFSTKIMFNIFE